MSQIESKSERVGEPVDVSMFMCELALLPESAKVNTRTHNIQTHNQHAQMNLSSELWVLLLMLLISTSPDSCSGGECANAHTNLAQTRTRTLTSYIVNLGVLSL